ncbi:hypothetical protein [Photobacterium lutimaris]|nr:hypothetical protein [Photobacterium lutimaris]TDR76197.1 hypothetical protein DFP78_103192 [Photobacterium lutimaris]
MDISNQIYWILLLAGAICFIAIRLIEKIIKRNKDKTKSRNQ